MAGLLLVTAARLVDFKGLFYTLKASRYDAGLVIVTALVGVVIDLDKAVLLGVILSIMLFVPRAAKLTAEELILAPERVVRERIADEPADPSIIIYDLEGELFFGAAPEFDRYLAALHQRIADDDVKFVVLRLKRVRHPDVVCIERIEHFLREETARSVTILLAGVRRDTLGVLRNVGIQSWFAAAHIFPEEDEEFSATLKAVRHARGHLDPVEVGRPPAKAIRLEDPPDLYYLV